MPVTNNSNSKNGNNGEVLYQRRQYEKGGVGRRYWDFRDEIMLREIPPTVCTILDAGCGEGITLEKLCSRFPGKTITGIDCLDENIEICKSFSLPASKGDLRNLTMADASVDCCVCAEVIEHIERYEEMLNELKRILKPGGRIVIVFPNDLVFKIARLATGMVKEAMYDPGHVRQWTPRALRTTLQTLGFKVLKIKCIPCGVWCLSLHCVAVAVKL